MSESVQAANQNNLPLALLDAAVPRPHDDHSTGGVRRAQALLRTSGRIAEKDLLCACVLGDATAVASILRRHPRAATTPGGPRSWKPLSYLCFSRFLRLRKRPISGFVHSARLLLNHGADPNTYFLSDPANPDSVKETALYGAAGVAHEPRLTKLLLDAGADVNDLTDGVGSESLYHASETNDLRCLRLLLSRGLRRDNIAYCLARKLDFEDIAGVRLYLRHGADVNFGTPFGERNTRLHHAVIRGRSPAIIKLLLQHGADVNARNGEGFTAYQLARRYGFTKVAELLLRYGAEPETNDRERFLSACASGDARTVKRLLRSHPEFKSTLIPAEQRLLSDAAASGHAKAVKLMLELGFDPNAPGDWGGSSLHQAAWNGHPALVKLLLANAARIDTKHQWGGDAVQAAIHGATHAGHDKGAAVVRAMLPAMKSKDLSPYLEAAREDGNAAVVRALQAAMSQAALRRIAKPQAAKTRKSRRSRSR